MTAPPLELSSLRSEDEGLVRLLDHLASESYAFITPTPATHALVAGRAARARPGSLRDIFGWGRPFSSDDVETSVLGILRRTGEVQDVGGLLQSRVRISSVDGRLHAHSAVGGDPDAVFLGPDSYRFVRFLQSSIPPAFQGRVLDIGTGAGVGALAIAAAHSGAEVTGTDVNPRALRYLAVNAAHAGLEVQGVLGQGLEVVTGTFDLIVANPPYVAGRGGRTYRDGGDAYGAEVALSWMRESVCRLNPGGMVALYTGSPVIDGSDVVYRSLVQLADERGLDLGYEEIDPDVFGGMLRTPLYADVERVAAIGATLRAPA